MPPRGTVAVKFIGDLSDLDRAMGKLDTRLGKTGSALTRTLTPAAAGLGLAFRSAFQEFDAGADALRAGTGATGKALDDLTTSMKNVGGQVTQGLSQVGETMADISRRTGLTGKPLERLTKQLLDLERIGNEADAESVTRVFGDWSIKAAESSEAMDQLFRASQATGPSVNRLGQLLVRYGAPLRQLGFGFAQSAALLGKFEKEGVNTELVLGSMRIALGKMARSGEDAESTFRRVVKEIETAGSTSQANAKALELFGARAGPDMAAAIREGRFALGDLIRQVESGGESISSAAKDTLDWTDKIAMLKNRVQGVIGPFGEMGMAIAGLAAGIGPVLSGIDKLRGGITGATGSSSRLSSALSAVPFGPMGVAAAAGGVALYAFAKAKADTRRRVEEFTAALRADTGAMGENTQALILNKLEHDNQLDDLNRAGVNMDLVTRAVGGNQKARKQLIETLDREGEANYGLIKNLAQLFSAHDTAVKKEKERAKFTKQAAAATREAAAATRAYSEALAGVSGPTDFTGAPTSGPTPKPKKKAARKTPKGTSPSPGGVRGASLRDVAVTHNYYGQVDTAEVSRKTLWDLGRVG
jgi:TP901 family phage tail tape measure protein